MRVIEIKKRRYSYRRFVVVVCLYPFAYPPFPYQNSARHKKTRKDKVEKALPAS